MAKTEITKIVLKVGINEFELTLKEAHELKKILNDTFPEKETVYIPSTPVIVERWPIPYQPYRIWCGDVVDNTYYLSTSTCGGLGVERSDCRNNGGGS